MNWQHVPHTWSSSRKTPVAETNIWSSDDARRCVGWSESARADVGAKQWGRNNRGYCSQTAIIYCLSERFCRDLFISVHVQWRTVLQLYRQLDEHIDCRTAVRMSWHQFKRTYLHFSRFVLAKIDLISTLANRQGVDKLFTVCFCVSFLFVYVCVRLRISLPKIKLAASYFAQRFNGVQGRESQIFVNFAPQEAQNRT